MRFIEDGPTIPDELLVARDEGRVVFFCGAGISRARAGLSDFFGLAKQVMHALGVSGDHVTRKVLRAAKESEVQHGVSGLISVDRIFGMLEREFTERDIEAAVANALRPKLDVDLSAHRTLVQLATTPSHKIRLVTTNFDRLFNDCDPAANAWKPPRLPDPSRPDELDGIVYLHGRANADYSGAEGDGFVLSSSEFGRAYLSHGWATQFFRAVIEKYVVVFVGYAADDPPVQYLLEALNKPRGSVRSIYAFQSGSADEAAARWRHKGIEAIAYAGENQHALLWSTLEAWADRAADPKRWHQSVLEFAKIGPGNLRPYQRGQVAHLVSTVEGAHQLAELEDPISAEWLCVFDPHRRYATPEPHYRLTAGALPVDPFEKYGIDFDVVPSRIDPNEYLARRTVPEGAWDCFATNRLDKGESTQHAMSSLRGSSATHPTEPPVRLIRIAVWFGKVAHEAAAVRWAARQSGLHPVMRRNVTWKLQNRKEPEYRVIKQAWRTLFDVWDTKVEFYDDWFNLKQIIEADGWDGGLARGYARVNRPRMKISFSTPFDPHDGAAVDSIGDLFPREVTYPEHFETLDVPSEWLPLVTRELRRNIEVAVALETEIGGYGLNSLDPLASDLSTELFGVREAGGLSGAIKSYIWHFERLLAADLPAAKQELLAWPDHGDAVFSQLRIWACGNPALVSAEAFSDVITSLSSTAFWNSYLQRDLLTTLIGRWIELPESGRRLIEGKLLEGPVKWPNEEQADYDERRARGVLERVSWLGSMGCAFVLIEKAELDRLELLIPHWKSAYAERAADSMESRGGFVKTDTDYKALLEIPLAEVTSVALKRGGRQESFLVENTPFAGLAAAYPIRAFRALTLAAKRGEYPAELWRQFFNAQTRENDCAKFMALIAERLCQLPMTAMEDLLRLLSAWLLKASKPLAQQYPATFEKAIAKVVTALRQRPALGMTGIGLTTKQRDWVMEAINAPAGYLAQAMSYDKRVSDATAGGGLDRGWLSVAEELLAMQSDLRRHAVVIFTHHLNWFHAIDPLWSAANLLTILDASDQEDNDAFWSGFLWGANMPAQQLYILLKPHLLRLATESSGAARGRVEVLAGMIVAGWGSDDSSTKQRLVSNEELRAVLVHAGDEFRTRVLSHLTMWTKDSAKDGGNKWRVLIPELMREAWPRQIAARTANTTAALVNLTLSDPELFAEISTLILPLLTPVRRGNHLMLHHVATDGQLVQKYPTAMLELMFAVLPDGANEWPYNSDELLSQIEIADERLRLDARFVELRRRWDSR